MTKLRNREEKLDYAKVFENMVTAVSNYLEECHLESMILGISGGIDSTINAAIGCEVFKRTGKKLIGLSLMTSTNMSDEDYAASLVGAEFCTEYYKYNMEDEYKTLADMCAHINGEGDNISRGNIKARMRMMILFDASARYKGIVFSGANKTEVLLGFSTLGGDSIGAIAPLSELFKHEVYEFAHWLKENVYTDSIALEKSIALTPTDGNGVMAGGDLAQIAPGFTYNDVDDMLYVYLDATNKASAVAELKTKYPADTVDMVIRRHNNSRFKRHHIPLIVDPIFGSILQNNGERLSETI